MSVTIRNIVSYFRLILQRLCLQTNNFDERSMAIHLCDEFQSSHFHVIHDLDYVYSFYGCVQLGNGSSIN